MENLELRTVWTERIRACRASGLKATTWCAANNVKIDQYKYYLQQQRKVERSGTKPFNETGARWLSVEVSASNPLEATRTRSQKTLLIKVGNASMEISSGFDPELLTEAVRALTSLC